MPQKYPVIFFAMRPDSVVNKHIVEKKKEVENFHNVEKGLDPLWGKEIRFMRLVYFFKLA